MTDDLAEPAPRTDRWLIAGWIAAISVALAGTIHDTDPYWQIRAGLENLDGIALARPDSWSWAPVDGLFLPNSPAWNLVLAIAWRGASWWGLYLVTVATIGASLALIAVLARRVGARRVPSVVAILLTCAAVLPVFSPRAALPAQALVLAAIAFAHTWSARRHRPAVPVDAAVVLAVGFAFSALGNWIHLSWSTLAVATAAAWAALWLLVPGTGPRGRRIALVVAGTAGLGLGVLAGPYGLGVVAQSRVVVEACRGLILEWTSPFDPAVEWYWALAALAAVLVTVLAAHRSIGRLRRRPPDPRAPLVVALTVSAAPFVVGGLLYIRFVLVALILLAPVTALTLTAGVDRLHRRVADPPASAGYLRRRLPEWTSDGFWRVIVWAVLAVLAPLALFAGSRHAQPATAAVNELLPSGCREFGTSPEAASIILTRPDVPVWFDARADYWGRARNVLANNYLYDLNQSTLVPPGTTCVVLSDASGDPGIARLTAALDADPAWHRVPGTVNANLWLPAGP